MGRKGNEKEPGWAWLSEGFWGRLGFAESSKQSGEGESKPCQADHKDAIGVETTREKRRGQESRRKKPRLVDLTIALNRSEILFASLRSATPNLISSAV